MGKNGRVLAVWLKASVVCGKCCLELCGEATAASIVINLPDQSPLQVSVLDLQLQCMPMTSSQTRL